MRRLARLIASPGFLVLASQGLRFRATEHALPPDARVVFADVDGLGRIVLTLESELFDETVPGEPIPELPAPVFRRCR
jgi:hypothetical protein